MREPDEIVQFLQQLKAHGVYPRYPEAVTIEGAPSGQEIVIQGKRLINFSSSNYLGLGQDPEVIAKAKQILETFGLACGGARWISGTTTLHEELEHAIAEFKKTEAAIVFPSGYGTNLGALPALVDPFFGDYPYKKGEAIFFSDELNHASLIDGMRLSHAQRVIYRHGNLEDLEEKLKEHKGEPRWIVSDGVFSMDGEIAKLDGLVELAERYGAFLYIDDAHGTGVLGNTGRGTAEFFGVEGRITVTMGTFSKSFGAYGGFIASTASIADYLRSSRSYIFAGAMPPVIAGSALASIRMLNANPRLVQKLRENTNQVRRKLQELGFSVLGDDGVPLVPVLLGSEDHATRFAHGLFGEGIFAPPLKWPAVPAGNARIRFMITAAHTEDHLNQLFEACWKLRGLS